MLALYLVLCDENGDYITYDGSSASTKSVSHSLQRGYVRVYTAQPYSETELYTPQYPTSLLVMSATEITITGAEA